MPNINQVLHTPEEAIAKGHCPECGRDLAESSFEVERMLHWPNYRDATKTPPEAYQRMDMLKAYFENAAKPEATFAEVK